MIRYKIIKESSDSIYTYAEVYINKTLICIIPDYLMTDWGEINFQWFEYNVLKRVNMSNIHKLISIHSMDIADSIHYDNF